MQGYSAGGPNELFRTVGIVVMNSPQSHSVAIRAPRREWSIIPRHRGGRLRDVRTRTRRGGKSDVAG